MTTQEVNAIEAESEVENQSGESPHSFSEQQFRKLVGRMHKTVSKVRRIDLAELLEYAWVDGVLDPFAERLVRSRPDLKEDIDQITQDLRAAD